MKRHAAFLLLALFFLFGSTPLHAVIHNIQVGNNFFAPLKTTVNYGDTVRWVWNGGIPHSTTSDESSPKQWNSGVSSTGGFTFDVVFLQADGAGPFPYHCSIHSLSMKDTIFVAVIDNDDDGFPEDIDCNDNDPSIYPGADEIPDDGIDQDCNGFDAVTCFIDSDNDGYGSFITTVSLNGSCDGPGLSDNNLDCADSDQSVNPDAFDVPGDEIDQDCNGFDAIICYIDSDNDGFGDSSDEGTVNPSGSCEEGFVPNNSDCDDTDPSQPPCGCCVGIKGNIDGIGGEPGIDIGDLVFMVEYQFLQGPQPSCLEEADIDGTPGIDIGDLVYMALYQFDGGSPPPSCN